MMSLKDALRHPRYQAILVLVGLTLSSGYLWRTFRYDRRMEELEVLSARDRNLTRANELARKAVGGEGMERVRNAIEAYDRQAAAVRFLLPDDTTTEPMLPLISRTAERYSVAITALNPADVVAGPDYDTRKYNLSIEGRYHDIGAFLAAVGSLDQIVRVSQFTAEVLPTTQTSIDIEQGRAVSAKMTLESYVRPTGDSTQVRRHPSGAGPASGQAYSTYSRDPNGKLWQYVHVPGKPAPIRIPVTPAGRAKAEEWLRANP